MLCGETGCFSALCVRGPVSPGVTWVRKLEGLHSPRKWGGTREKSASPRRLVWGVGAACDSFGEHVRAVKTLRGAGVQGANELWTQRLLPQHPSPHRPHRQRLQFSRLRPGAGVHR